MGRFKELWHQDLNPMWQISNQSVMQKPLIHNDLDWLLRFSESNTLVQKYIRQPFLLNNKKTVFKFTVLVKSVVPLQAWVLK